MLHFVVGDLLLTHLAVTNRAGKVVDTPRLVKCTEYWKKHICKLKKMN